MAQDRIEKIKLSIGKRAAAFSRAAALKLEIHRLRLEARTLRAEARQTEKMRCGGVFSEAFRKKTLRGLEKRRRTGKRIWKRRFRKPESWKTP